MDNNRAPLIVGIDDGHDGIKISYFDTKDRKFINYRMPSVAQMGIGDMGNAPQEEINSMLVNISYDTGVVQYLIDSERKVITTPMETRFKEYPYSDLNIALIAQALRLAGVPFGKIIVVSGLPMNQYFDKINNSRNELLIEKKEESIKRLNTVRSAATPNMFYQVVSVRTLPEGYGVAIDATIGDNLEPKEFAEDIEETGFIVIDIGGRTVDFVKMMPNIQPRSRDSLSFDSGMLFLRDEIRSRVADRIGVSGISDKIVDNIIQTGWHGRPNKKGSTDLSEIRDLILKSFAEKIHREIKGVLNNSDEAMGGVVITGGGSHALGQYLKTALEEGGFRYEIIIEDEPEFSNAKGFCKFAMLN